MGTIVGGSVLLSVCDTGAGMGEATLTKPFRRVELAASLGNLLG